MAQAIIGVGLSIVAGMILRRIQKKPRAEFDNSTPTLSERGSFAPMVLGRRRIGPVIAAVWGRRAEQRSGGGGGKGGSSSGGSPYNVYYEKAWHVLCVGPIYQLHGFFVSDKQAYLGNTPAAHGAIRYEEAEGILIQAATVGAAEYSYLRCYYGTEDQQIETESGLDVATGVSSKWPNIAYVVWDERYLGQSPAWPSLEYDVTVKIDNPVLTQSEAWLDSGGVSGVNPAHALYQILTAPYPWGCNIPAEHLDLDYFEALGEDCETEHIPINLVAADGAEAIEIISAVLGDHGIAIPQVGDVLSPVLLREVTSGVPTLTTDLLSSAPEERDVANESNQISRKIYQFANAGNLFSTQDIVVEDDSILDTKLVKKESRDGLETVTHYTQAVQVVERKEQEALVGSQAVKRTAARRSINLAPGDVYDDPDGNQYRVTATKILPDAETVEITAVPDIYADSASSMDDTEPTYPDGPSSSDPAADIFRTLSATRAFSSSLACMVVRGRANDFMSGATAYFSLAGSSYTSFGEASSHALAVGLVRAVTSDGRPIFTIAAGDAADVNDNSVQVPDVRYLSQSIAFGFDTVEEVAAYDTWTDNTTPDPTTASKQTEGFASVRSLTKIEAYSRTINGETELVTYDGEQAWIPTMTDDDDEFQTKRNDPVLGEYCFIFLRDTSILHESEDFYARVDTGAPDTTFCKSQPYGDTGALDITTITPDERYLTGAVSAPLPAQDFATSLTDNEHNGTNVTFEWTAVESDSYSSGVSVEDFIIEIRNLDGDLVGGVREQSGTAGSKSVTVALADIIPVAADREAFYADIFACDDADNPLYRSCSSRILVSQDDTFVLRNGRNTAIAILGEPGA